MFVKYMTCTMFDLVVILAKLDSVKHTSRLREFAYLPLPKILQIFNIALSHSESPSILHPVCIDQPHPLYRRTSLNTDVKIWG